ncbi:isatin hydrolase-like [Adelges cooleyi]|uniref:isatin hydrolase-like n=1 Tax=Adelges cooleyi TaxID=133065 RepID=UPI00218005D5|nr:isatin hydrolase-like [Adelges cooleyi]
MRAIFETAQLFLTVALLVVTEQVAGLVSDLSHGYWTNTTNCRNLPDYFTVNKVIQKNLHEDGTWVRAEYFNMAVHCGTHLDAPYHAYSRGWKLGEIPLERFIVEGVHINVSKEVNGNADFVLTVDHLEAWEKLNGPIPSRSVVLVNFGWAHRFGDRLATYNSTDRSAERFPGISAPAAQWIVNTGKVYGVGVDGPSVDPGRSKDFEVHRTITKANMYILENVALNGTRLPSRGFKLIAQPFKFLDGTGGPCRILAFTE